MTLILALDTTSKYASIAVSKGDDTRIEFNFASRDDLSATLIPAIQSVLKCGSRPLKLCDINVFGIAVGPGLFTGIRVGLSALKGLILGQKKPVVPVITLNALADKFIQPGFTTIPLIDARRDEVYIAGFNVPGNDNSETVEIREVVSPGLIHISQLNERVSKEKDLVFIGSGAEAHEGYIRENFQESKIVRRSAFLAPEICKIAYHQYKKGEYITDLQQLVPFYIRKPDAEENLIKRKYNDKKSKNR